ALLLLGEIFVVGRVVLRLEAQVADDDIVQSADRLAEAQRLAQRPGKADPITAQVWRQRHGQATAVAANTAATEVSDLQIHESPPHFLLSLYRQQGLRVWHARLRGIDQGRSRCPDMS